MNDLGQPGTTGTTGAAGRPRPLLQLLAAAVVYLVASQVDFLAGVVLLALLAAVWPPRVGGYRPIAWRAVLLVYPPFLIVWLAIAFGYLHVMHALGQPVAPQPQLQRLAEQGTDHEAFAVAVVAIVVIAPVWEEILFRGYLFAALAAHTSRSVTHLGTAAVFGLVHGLEYAFPIGVLALLFGWLRARYDALLPAMLAHAVHNGVTVGVALLFPDFLDWMYPA